jgi:hypothetical protein
MTKVAPERYYVSIARWFAILCMGYGGYVAVSLWLRNSLWSRNRRQRQVGQTISNINGMKRYRESHWYNRDDE